MAVKDPKAARSAFHYQGGRVVGAIGLLEAVFGTADLPNTAEITVDSRGRRRLKNVMRTAAAIGGKQIIVHFKSGEKFQMHYSGALVDFRLNAVPKMERGTVKSWSTARGTAQAL